MARRIILAPALAALAAVVLAASAFAHAGNSDYESLVDRISPHVPGFSVVVLGGDDRLEAVNNSSTTVTIDGYNEEPYILMEAGGAVSVNVRSPATYLNRDREGTAPIPASADPKAPPRWKVVARDGRYQFHDHRMHWMGAKTPPLVKDPSVRTKVVDWRVPLHAGGADGAIAGTLFWRGSSGGPPAGASVALALLVLAGAATVLIARRRRGAAGRADSTGEAGEDGEAGAGSAAKPPAEAW